MARRSCGACAPVKASASPIEARWSPSSCRPPPLVGQERSSRLGVSGPPRPRSQNYPKASGHTNAPGRSLTPFATTCSAVPRYFGLPQGSRRGGTFPAASPRVEPRRGVVIGTSCPRGSPRGPSPRHRSSGCRPPARRRHAHRRFRDNRSPPLSAKGWSRRCISRTANTPCRVTARWPRERRRAP